jgi:hypothetical protein
LSAEFLGSVDESALLPIKDKVRKHMNEDHTVSISTCVLHTTFRRDPFSQWGGMEALTKAFCDIVYYLHSMLTIFNFQDLQ